MYIRSNKMETKVFVSNRNRSFFLFFKLRNRSYVVDKIERERSLPMWVIARIRFDQDSASNIICVFTIFKINNKLFLLLKKKNSFGLQKQTVR